MTGVRAAEVSRCRVVEAALQHCSSTADDELAEQMLLLPDPRGILVCRKTLGAAAAVRARASYKTSLVQVCMRNVGAQAKCACLCAQHLVVQRVRSTLFCFLFFFVGHSKRESSAKVKREVLAKKKKTF